jgi:hypothetical protein
MGAVSCEILMIRNLGARDELALRLRTCGIPEVSVGVAEVAGVDPPWAIVGCPVGVAPACSAWASSASTSALLAQLVANDKS